MASTEYDSSRYFWSCSGVQPEAPKVAVKTTVPSCEICRASLAVARLILITLLLVDDVVIGVVGPDVGVAVSAWVDMLDAILVMVVVLEVTVKLCLRIPYFFSLTNTMVIVYVNNSIAGIEFQ